MTDYEMLAEATEIARAIVYDDAVNGQLYGGDGCDTPPEESETLRRLIRRLQLATSWAKESLAKQAMRDAIKMTEAAAAYEDEALRLIGE